MDSFHQIQAIGINDTGEDLTLHTVPDELFGQMCSTVIKGFCYQVNEDGSVAMYPYKDLSLLISIQDQNDIREIQLTETYKGQVELDFRVTMLEATSIGSKSELVPLK